MRKNLTVIGNSLGLILDKAILDLLGIDRNTTLEVTTDGDRIVIDPIRPRRKRVVADDDVVTTRYDRSRKGK